MYGEPKPPEPAGPAIRVPSGTVGDARRPPRILVLDDSAAQRKLLVTLLRRWGFEATACADPEDALTIAQDPAIGLIVSDWMMPGMTGPEFCRRLRASGRDGYQYVILLTSKSDTSDLSEGLAAGADDFLTKPVSPHELKARLNAGARIVAMQAELIEKTRSLGDALAKIRQLYDAIETDLDEARRLQTSFLDDTHRRFASARVSLWLKASGHVGGDMVGFFEVSPQVFGFYSMDVSGHGVAAGMLAARVAGMLRDNAPDLNIALSFIGGGHFAPVPPDMVAAQLNAQILNEAKGERYLTLCLGFLDQRSGVIRMVQAGHPTPLLLRADGGIERLGNGGMPLGLIPEARYRQFEFLMRAGDKLLLYSDGLTECPVADGTYLEEDGLVELCRLHGHASGEDMIARMAADLEEMSGGVDFPDDASALLVEFDGPSG
ncbi:MAG: Serine phosphatase RsbU, regulator of sigma subunit [Rhodobacteraceae bacterium HLUCCO18]|nr:MAG: Serine phosphatase RsbU, regulator of sigma subunit [Rhodobacteraceae bacterium HLUCCO18]